ncbi:type II secretion system major pseudopilin GspG [Paraburkholderia kururiensis]|uniref:type II secretion system major pseudopilin GspG n=1 Tax=Paraburkholderia TaxID=1822464 RepID=UPI003BA1DA7B
MKKSIVFVLSSALVLAACKPATQVPSLDRVYNVSEYDADFELRQRVLAACAANPGELQHDPNCVNVTTSHLGNARDEDRQYEARKIAATQDIAVIMMALKLYRLDNGAYPTQAQGLKALVEKPVVAPVPANWKQGGYLERLVNDPWGRPYQFLNPGAHGEIDVYSVGPLNHPNDEGTGAIGSWQPAVSAAEKEDMNKSGQ